MTGDRNGLVPRRCRCRSSAGLITQEVASGADDGGWIRGSEQVQEVDGLLASRRSSASVPALADLPARRGWLQEPVLGAGAGGRQELDSGAEGRKQGWIRGSEQVQEVAGLLA